MNPKIAKTSVKYRPATLGWFTGTRCGTCTMYRPSKEHPTEGHCTLVTGQIEAAYVCDRWAGKAWS